MSRLGAALNSPDEETKVAPLPKVAWDSWRSKNEWGRFFGSSPFLFCYSLAMVDDDELEDEPEPPAPADLTRPLRRLAAAILVQAIEDLRFWNPNVRRDALSFLLPRDRHFHEHLQLMLTVSRTDQRSFRRYMSKTAPRSF